MTIQIEPDAMTMNRIIRADGSFIYMVQFVDKGADTASIHMDASHWLHTCKAIAAEIAKDNDAEGSNNGE